MCLCCLTIPLYTFHLGTNTNIVLSFIEVEISYTITNFRLCYVFLSATIQAYSYSQWTPLCEKIRIIANLALPCYCIHSLSMPRAFYGRYGYTALDSYKFLRKAILNITYEIGASCANIVFTALYSISYTVHSAQFTINFASFVFIAESTRCFFLWIFSIIMLKQIKVSNAAARDTLLLPYIICFYFPIFFAGLPSVCRIIYEWNHLFPYFCFMTTLRWCREYAKGQAEEGWSMLMWAWWAIPAARSLLSFFLFLFFF